MAPVTAAQGRLTEHQKHQDRPENDFSQTSGRQSQNHSTSGSDGAALKKQIKANQLAFKERISKELLPMQESNESDQKEKLLEKMELKTSGRQSQNHSTSGSDGAALEKQIEAKLLALERLSKELLPMQESNETDQKEKLLEKMKLKISQRQESIETHQKKKEFEKEEIELKTSGRQSHNHSTPGSDGAAHRKQIEAMPLEIERLSKELLPMQESNETDQKEKLLEKMELKVDKKIKEYMDDTGSIVDKMMLAKFVLKTLSKARSIKVLETDVKISLIPKKTIDFIVKCAENDLPTAKYASELTKYFSSIVLVSTKNIDLKDDLQQAQKRDQDTGLHHLPVKADRKRQTPKTSDSSSDSSEEDESELSDLQLYSFYDDMRRSCIGFRPFSYYLVSDFELVVHTETPCQDEHDLKTRILEVLKRCGMSTVEVSVKGYSAGAQLCSGPLVGSSVFVNPSSPTGTQQKLGMYLQYGKCVYWLSTAHAAIQVLHNEKTLNLHEPIGDSYITPIHIEESLLVGFDHTQRLPTPYLCFSFEECEYSDDQTCLHSVDIMVGPVPFTTDDLSCNGSASTVRNGMLLAGHRFDEDGMKYDCYSTGIKIFKRGGNESRPIFKVKSALQDKLVYTTMEHKKPMVLGKIINARLGNKLVFELFPTNRDSVAPRPPDTLRFASADAPPTAPEALNVVFIESRSDDQLPKVGDSGSVWFIPEGEQGTHETHYKAVALTIGIVKEYGERKQTVWIATPLCAALFGLSKKYSTIFPNYKNFKTAY